MAGAVMPSSGGTTGARLAFTTLVVLTLCALALPGGWASATGARSASPVALSPRPDAAPAVGDLPLTFVPNAGQHAEHVRYAGRTGNAMFAFAADGVTMGLRRGAQATDVRLGFPGADPDVSIVGRDITAGRVNVLHGSDPRGWQTDLPTYRTVVYQDLWPGIDLAFRDAGGALKYEFVVRPGASAANIALAYDGADAVTLGDDGALTIDTALGALRDEAPHSYQQVGVRRVKVDSRFVVDGATVRFALGHHDPTLPLVVDPGIAYATLVGGAADDTAATIAVDAAGHAYIAGRARSGNFPTTPGAAQPASAGGYSDAYVTKLSPDGRSLVWSTYLGGALSDAAFGLAIDALGNVYVAGSTESVNFPVTAGAYDTQHNGKSDVFVAKLRSDGSTLVYSTYLGASEDDVAYDVAVGAAGDAYVTGYTWQNEFVAFPTTPGAFDTRPVRSPSTGIHSEAFVTRLDPSGSGLMYSTYLGGISGDTARAIEVDATGAAYVTGLTGGDFPTTAGAFDTSYGGPQDGFVTKVAPSGTALVWSTYLGGSSSDSSIGLDVDPEGNVYVTGQTSSADFPTTPGVWDRSYDGSPGDAFVTKLDPSGASLRWSTYLGGGNGDYGQAIVVDAAGRAHTTGYTRSTTFPTPNSTIPAIDPTFNGGLWDAFVTRFSADGSTLEHATYLGGGGNETGFGIALAPDGQVLVAGDSSSADFPTTAGAYQAGLAGGSDAFVARLDLEPEPVEPAAVVLTPDVADRTAGDEHCVVAVVTDARGAAVPNQDAAFAVTGANAAEGTAVTDAVGEAAFCWTGTAAGDDEVTATAGQATGTAVVTWWAGPAASVGLAPPDGSLPAGGEHCVTATVVDAYANPIGGASVHFAVSGANTAEGLADTDAAGTASFCFTGSAVGDDHITATVGSATGTATVTWTDPSPPPASCGWALGGGQLENDRRVTIAFGAVDGGAGPLGNVSFSERLAANNPFSRGIWFVSDRLLSATFTGDRVDIVASGRSHEGPATLRLRADESSGRVEVHMSTGYFVGGKLTGPVLVDTQPCQTPLP